MFNYTLRRLLLLPITLFFIVLINFVVINLAPGDPVTTTEVSEKGDATRQERKGIPQSLDDPYLQFREFYGLTLPILWNLWPYLNQHTIEQHLESLLTKRQDGVELSVKEYTALRIKTGDEARFVMPKLLAILENPNTSPPMKALTIHMFVRGGTRQALLGYSLSPQEKAANRKIATDNDFLRHAIDNPAAITQLRDWYNTNKTLYCFEPNVGEKISIFFFETRFCKYMSRVLSLDFGTLRNDPNKTVISEVAKRFKYSFALAIVPMFITFALCLCFGFLMAIRQNSWIDISLNIIFLVLYATPVFVAAPFMIEKIALHHTFPFTTIPIPISGFNSPDAIYDHLSSAGRLFDILEHIALPIIAIMYGSLAAQSRLARTAVLEVLRQDFVRTARAKGLAAFTILWHHVGRNAAITIVTSLAGSLGIILGGSLIVETIFEINGFGYFFYEAILNRDYNVIMFSALAGSFLTLLSYLIADIMYTLLDPRVTLD